jgi:N-acetylmuramoyl-L-alanine amidase
MRSFDNLRVISAGLTLVLAAGLWCGVPAASAAQSASQMYTSALARERTIRDADEKPTLKQLRALAAAYERIVSRFPRSGYCDNALWQAAGVYALAYERFGQPSDRRQAQRAVERLRAEYPASSLRARADEILSLLSTRPALAASKPKPVATPPDASPAVDATVKSPAPLPVVATLARVKRSEIGNVVRITLELDSEITYREERVDRPARVFFDLKNVRLGTGVKAAPINFNGDVLKQVRLGAREDGSTRVAMDLSGTSRYSVFTLYNPYRLVVDFERDPAPVATAVQGHPATTWEAPAAAALPSPPAPARQRDARETPSPDNDRPRLPVGASPLRIKSAEVAAAPRSDVPAKPVAAAAPEPAMAGRRTLKSEPTDSSDTPVPTVPATNGSGNYSLARQLGLSVARVVIDPGHGGHDPGAQGYHVVEAELVLDVALRLEKLLLKEKGVDVVMTRRTDVFIPLEERTAIANRVGADLFLSIHANASANATARGIETYYLNFASNPEAEAVAARENSASSRTLHVLPDIIKAIALNDKLDESRDFAELVQNAMSKRLRAQNARIRSLGVKRAPFVVLIGAGMPSVLAEISFVTNKQEAALLKTGAYRQRIAEALFDAVTQYQRSLKKVTAVADGATR